MMPGKKTTETDAIIGRNIRDVRKKLGLTQRQLAVMLGMTYQQVQKYESGGNRISASTLIELACKMDAPLSDLLAHVERDQKLPRERAARALCELAGHLPDVKVEGKPLWQSYLPEVDAVLRAALSPEEWKRMLEANAGR